MKETGIYVFIFSKSTRRLALVRYFKSGYYGLIGGRIESGEDIFEAFSREAEEEIGDKDFLIKYDYKLLEYDFHYEREDKGNHIFKTDKYIIINLENEIDIEFKEDKAEIIWVDLEEYINQIPFVGFADFFKKNILSLLI